MSPHPKPAPTASIPVGSTTLVGSLPHASLDRAVEITVTAAPRLPAVPELPAAEPRWAMVPSALWGVAGVEVRADGSWDAGGAEPGVELPEDHPVRAAAAAVQARSEPGTPIKLQTAGPVTLAMAGLPRSIAADVVAARVAQLAGLVDRAVVVLDEPSLVVLRHRDPPVAASWAAEALASVVQSCDVAVGVHCCGATTWEVVVDAHPAMISLPAALAHPALRPHGERGGWVVWGVVPTTGPLPDRRAVAEAVRRADEVAGAERHLLSPECGLHACTPERAEQVVGALVAHTDRR